jgi:hypothetical protein
MRFNKDIFPPLVYLLLSLKLAVRVKQMSQVVENLPIGLQKWLIEEAKFILIHCLGEKCSFMTVPCNPHPKVHSFSF